MIEHASADISSLWQHPNYNRRGSNVWDGVVQNVQCNSSRLGQNRPNDAVFCHAENVWVRSKGRSEQKPSTFALMCNGCSQRTDLGLRLGSVGCCHQFSRWLSTRPRGPCSRDF